MTETTSTPERTAVLGFIGMLAQRERDVRESLEGAIREAYGNPQLSLSLRDLATATGLNHETIRTIVRRGN